MDGKFAPIFLPHLMRLLVLLGIVGCASATIRGSGGGVTKGNGKPPVAGRTAVSTAVNSELQQKFESLFRKEVNESSEKETSPTDATVSEHSIPPRPSSDKSHQSCNKKESSESEQQLSVSPMKRAWSQRKPRTSSPKKGAMSEENSLSRASSTKGMFSENDFLLLDRLNQDKQDKQSKQSKQFNFTHLEMETIIKLANFLKVNNPLRDKVIDALVAYLKTNSFNLTPFKGTHILQHLEEKIEKCTENFVSINDKIIQINGFMSLKCEKQNNYFRMVANLVSCYEGIWISDLQINSKNEKLITACLAPHFKTMMFCELDINIGKPLEWNFSNFNNLKEFSWIHCRNGYEMLSMFQSLPPCLTWLQLADIDFGENPAPVLTKILNGVPKLNFLDLSEVHLSEYNDGKLMESIFNLKHLEHLNLADSMIGMFVANMISRCTEPLPWKKINFHSCGFNRAHFEEKVRKWLPMLIEVIV